MCGFKCASSAPGSFYCSRQLQLALQGCSFSVRLPHDTPLLPTAIEAVGLTWLLVVCPRLGSLPFDAFLWCRAAWGARSSCRHTSFQRYACGCAASATARLCRGCEAAKGSRHMLLDISLCRSQESPALHLPSKDYIFASPASDITPASQQQPIHSHVHRQAAHLAVSRQAVH